MRRARDEARLLVHEALRLPLPVDHRVHDHLGELPKVLLVGEGEAVGSWLAVDDAERPELVPPGSDEGCAGVEAYEGGAGDEAAVGEARVEVGVGDDEDVLGGVDGVGAEGELAGGLGDLAEAPECVRVCVCVCACACVFEFVSTRENNDSQRAKRDARLISAKKDAADQTCNTSSQTAGLGSTSKTNTLSSA